MKGFVGMRIFYWAKWLRAEEEDWYGVTSGSGEVCGGALLTWRTSVLSVETLIWYCRGLWLYKECQNTDNFVCFVLFLMCSLLVVETLCGPNKTHLGSQAVGLQSLDEMLQLWLCILLYENALLPLLSASIRFTRKQHPAETSRSPELQEEGIVGILVLHYCHPGPGSGCLQWVSGSLANQYSQLPVFPSNPCGMCFAFSWLLLMSKFFFRWLDNQGPHELVKWLHSSAEGRGMRKERRGITESFGLISMQVCGSGFWLAPAEQWK